MHKLDLPEHPLFGLGKSFSAVYRTTWAIIANTKLRLWLAEILENATWSPIEI